MVYITPHIEIVDLALYIPLSGTIIFSDFHIGYEEALASAGALIPRFQFGDTLKRLEGIFAALRGKAVKTIVINGDLKHEFGAISAQEWRNILKLLDYFAGKAERIIIVKGNHDVMLGPVARKRNLRMVTEYRVGESLIAHGDAIAEKTKLQGIRTIIIGHEHPALGVREHRRVELVKCFLKGVWKRRTLIVQPSFNLLVEGTDVLQGRFLSPYLQQPLGAFEVYAVPKPGEVLYFGRIRGLK